jgi:hypothetical protein
METTQYTIGNKTLEIVHDEHPENPRNWDNLGTLLFSHKRYNFGDEKKAETLTGTRDHIEWMNYAKRKDVISLPVYMYDHSGQTVRVGRNGNPFTCPWDSGLIGWIVVPKAHVRKEYSWKKLTAARIEKIKTYLEGEIETYDQYMTGDTYGFRLLENGEETDSCWGFFGSDVRTNGILDHVDKEWEQFFPENSRAKLLQAAA